MFHLAKLMVQKNQETYQYSPYITEKKRHFFILFSYVGKTKTLSMDVTRRDLSNVLAFDHFSLFSQSIYVYSYLL